MSSDIWCSLTTLEARLHILSSFCAWSAALSHGEVSLIRSSVRKLLLQYEGALLSTMGVGVGLEYEWDGPRLVRDDANFAGQ
jgi:tryptophan synthase beta subunit